MICVSDEGYEVHFKPLNPSSIVQFKNHNPKKELPLPNPALLALHAACARVLHMSGAAEYFDQCDRDDEELRVLSEDGSSFEHLYDRLHSAAILAA